MNNIRSFQFIDVIDLTMYSITNPDMEPFVKIVRMNEVDVELIRQIYKHRDRSLSDLVRRMQCNSLNGVKDES